jgi:hypothetical protein
MEEVSTMTGAARRSAHTADEDRRDEAADAEQSDSSPWAAAALPGVMDFIGAHVGGELAEERWR